MEYTLSKDFACKIPCPPGGLLSPKSYVDVPARPRKPDYLYTIFCLISHPSVYHFRKKAPNLNKLGAFYNNLPQIHPIYVIWAPSSLMKTPQSLYQISRKSAPKGRHIYVYHVNMRPPGPVPNAAAQPPWACPVRPSTVFFLMTVSTYFLILFCQQSINKFLSVYIALHQLGAFHWVSHSYYHEDSTKS